ncbi:MAG: thioredoxin family protein [Labilithrix sp.]|nr:thioredoxin family protein [Labilithrix sp.]
MIRRAALALLSLASACHPALDRAPAAPTRAVIVPGEVLPFVHDDYPRALAEAKRLRRPLFVDSWAPWCHTCLSMRSYVLGDPSLAPLAKDFVWLAIDTEKEQNGGFVERFPNRVWPTLWVVDPEREAAILKWEGSATAPELLTLLASVRSGDAFARANQAAARGDVAEAERGYRAVLAAPNDPERPRAVEALAGVLARRNDHAACAELAAREGPALPSGTSRATVIAIGLSCARDGKRDEEEKKLVDAAERFAADPDPRTTVDDRSALYEELVETKKEKGDEAGAKAIARTWASFLEREAARAPNAEARAVFDAHRLGAYLAAGEPQRAVPMLQASERDFPDDYNPPARLARAYLTMGKLDEARAAVDRATARVYGPRSLRVFALAADVAKARNDVAGERSALEQALARTARAVLSEGQKKLRDDLGRRLGTLTH